MFPHKENVKYYLYCLYFTKLIKKIYWEQRTSVNTSNHKRFHTIVWPTAPLPLPHPHAEEPPNWSMVEMQGCSALV